MRRFDDAEEAIELGEFYTGHKRDEAQKIVLRAMMGTQENGKWAAGLACHAVSRQNGKGDEVEDREFYGLTVLDEPILHTAHELPTSKRAFERMEYRFQSSTDLRRLVAKFKYANGEWGILLKSGAFIEYRARTFGGGRGIDDIGLVVYDEAQHLKPEHLAASSPTGAVHPNPQTIMTGSAGLSTSEVWWAKRLDALRKIGLRVAYVEHTAEIITINEAGEIVSIVPDPRLEKTWADANPAYGFRISGDFMLQQLSLLASEALGDRLFLREHCGVWDALPPSSAKVAKVITEAEWKAAEDLDSRAVGPVLLAVGVSPGSASSSIAFTGARIDGALHVEIVEYGPGTGWLIARLERALKGSGSKFVAVEANGPESAVVPELETLCAKYGAKLVKLSGGDFAGACDGYVVGTKSLAIRHKGQAWLNTAVGGASKRAYGPNRWVWDRWADVDPTALVSATVAVRAWLEEKPEEQKSAYEDDGLMTV